MSRPVRGLCGFLLPLLLLAGCAAWSTPPPAGQPLFSAEGAEAKSLQALARKQEAVAARCAEQNSCDHVYFTRALLGLYESREVAVKYFEKVVAASPKSQLAASSKLWIQLLENQGRPGEPSWLQAVLTAPAVAENNAVLVQTSDRLVRDLLNRELTIQQLRSIKDADAQALEALQRELSERDKKVESLSGKREAAKNSPEIPSVQVLQKQLTERDRKIEELSSQLEALKRIDQEMREKIRPIRPPSATAPVPSPDLTP